MFRSKPFLLGVLVLMTTSSFVLASDEPDLAAGKELWKFCSFCHGANGMGKRPMNTPKVAGDPAWYTERQLRLFRKKIRGGHPDDQAGLQMFIYSYPLYDEAQIQSMAAFIEALPVSPSLKPPTPPVNARPPRPLSAVSKVDQQQLTREPDATIGAKLYEPCGVCHGQTGEGLLALNGPRLDNKQDWYLIRQIKYFMNGIRGTHAEDIFGQQMAAQSSLKTEQDIADVIAYINTFSIGPMTE